MKRKVKEKHFTKLLEIIGKALERVDDEYFAYKVAGSLERKAAERSFCYEFYHQARILLGEAENFPYRLAGELNKGGHPIIRGNSIPYFVVHQFDSMENNLCVIEIKRIEGNAKGFQKDLRTLKNYRATREDSPPWYQHGILLVFGSRKNGLKKIKEKVEGKVRNAFQAEPDPAGLAANSIVNLRMEKIHILWKPSKTEPVMVLE